MEILVSDTSILIDLERAGLEDIVFPSAHRWVVPDLLYETELKDWTGADWLRRGLQSVALEADEVSTAQGHFTRHGKLSLNDCFAFALAMHRRWTLLTSDAALRTLALEHTLPCHGFLWVIELARAAGADIVLLEQGLRRLMAHPQCRLPRTETQALLRSLLSSPSTPENSS